MILKYTNIGHENLEDYKKKKLEIKVFKPKEFDEYKEEMEQQNQRVVVIRNTKLKELKDDSDEVKDEEYLEIDNRKFKLIKERGRVAVAYIPIDELTFVRIESNILLFIILLGILLAGICFLTQVPMGDTEEPLLPLPDIEMDSDAGDWDGTQHDNGGTSQATQDNIIIPGYGKVKASKEAGLLKLYNPEENTVNFIYLMTEETNNEAVENFSSIDEAQKYVTDNTIKYENYYDEANDDYKLKDADGNITDEMIEYKITSDSDGTYTVNKSTSTVIYFTKGIAPDKYVDWNITDYLSTGEHTIQFRISTFDVDTNSACYGAIQEVNITIQ